MKDMKMGKKGSECPHKPSKMAPPFAKGKGKDAPKKGAKPNPFAK